MEEDVVNGAAGTDVAKGADVTVAAGEDGVVAPVVVVALRIVPYVVLNINIYEYVGTYHRDQIQDTKFNNITTSYCQKMNKFKV